MKSQQIYKANAHEDSILIARAQKGEDAAIEALLLCCEKRIYNTAFRYMGSEADAYDMAQESLIKIYKKLPTYRSDASFLSWAYRICVNTCLDGLRKRKKTPVPTDYIENGAETGFSMPSPEKYAVSSENKETLQKAINALVEEQKSVIILRDINGLSYEEVAQCLEISVGTVKSRICRGRQKLREMLGAAADWNKS